MLGSSVTWSEVAVHGLLPAVEEGERVPGMVPALLTGELKHLQPQRAIPHAKEWQARGHKLQPSADGGWLAHS